METNEVAIADVFQYLNNTIGKNQEKVAEALNIIHNLLETSFEKIEVLEDRVKELETITRKISAFLGSVS